MTAAHESGAESEHASEHAKAFASFDEFWDFYVKEHQSPWTRRLHFAGTTAAVGTLVLAAILKRPSLVLLALVCGYGPAWASHFFVEGNRPATFKHPLWSLRADFVMWKKMLFFQMDAEVERVLRDLDAAPDEAPEAAPKAEASAASNDAPMAADVSVN